jgi:hypothetical protein
VDIVQQESQIVNSWFSRESGSDIYVYYIRIALSDEFSTLDTSTLTANSEPITSHRAPFAPKLIKVPNDSAIWDGEAGLGLLVKHMGFAPISANLYVLSPNASLSPVTVQYSHDRSKAQQYDSLFKTTLHACDGRHASVGDNDVWCFHIEDSNINTKKGKAQYLGRVTGNGGQADLFAVRLDYQEPSLSILLKDVK